MPCGSQHPAYVTLNVWPAPAPPALRALEYPVGLLLELWRLVNPDAMAGGGAWRRWVRRTMPPQPNN